MCKAQLLLLTVHEHNIHIYPYKSRKTLLGVMMKLRGPNAFTNISLPFHTAIPPFVFLKVPVW